MRRIELITGYACNTPCRFCTSGRQGADQHSRDTLFEVMQKYRKAGFQGIIFGGGEPSVHPDIIELIKSAREMGYSEIELKTNGVRFCYPEFVEKISSAGVDRYSVSIWGHNPAAHDWMAGRAGAYEMTEMGIKHLIHFGCDVKIDFLLSTISCEHEWESLVDLMNAGVKKIDIWVYSIFGSGGWGKDLVPTMKDAGIKISEFVDVVSAKKVRVRTSHVPPCLMRQKDKAFFNVEEYNLLIVTSPDHAFKAEESPFEKGEHIEKCFKCDMKELCPGPRVEYIKEFGSSEFHE